VICGCYLLIKIQNRPRRSSLVHRIDSIHTQKPALFDILYPRAGIRGRSGPPGNQNAFRHGLAGIAQRRSGRCSQSHWALDSRRNPGWIARRQGRRCADKHSHARVGRDNRQRRVAIGSRL